jgi:hypothetical protein
VEDPAARQPQKSLNASAATIQMAVTEPNRSQSPLCLCKAAPTILPSLVPAPSPEDGSQLFVALAGRLVQMRLGVGADRDQTGNAIAVPPRYTAEAIASRRWLRQCLRDVRAPTNRLVTLN